MTPQGERAITSMGSIYSTSINFLAWLIASCCLSCAIAASLGDPVKLLSMVVMAMMAHKLGEKAGRTVYGKSCRSAYLTEFGSIGK